MEHRNGTRKPSGWLVTLSQAGLHLGVFPVHNVSSGGMAIVGKIANLPLNRLVTVTIMGITADSSEQPQVKALVVHQNNNLIGLMWIETSHVLQSSGRFRSESTTASMLE